MDMQNNLNRFRMWHARSRIHVSFSVGGKKKSHRVSCRSGRGVMIKCIFIHLSNHWFSILFFLKKIGWCLGANRCVMMTENSSSWQKPALVLLCQTRVGWKVCYFCLWALLWWQTSHRLQQFILQCPRSYKVSSELHSYTIAESSSASELILLPPLLVTVWRKMYEQLHL